MANELDALLARVDDPALRRDLVAQMGALRRKRRFGLVFEEHMPERVLLPGHTIRRGARVAARASEPEGTGTVLKVAGGTATVAWADEVATAPVDDLVVVAAFGEPIYPGLRHLGSVTRAPDRPGHVLIKGENYHALEALQFTHRGRIDCIYIDPPYNTGARDWKYNNDYVDGDDAYRHSKWLAFMQRRLRLAKALLDPRASVLIATIDEKEYLRLGLLLEQVFPDARVQMISMTISPRGTSRTGEFSRVDEYAFFVFVGEAALSLPPSSADEQPVRWLYLRRTQKSLVRGSRKNQFYAVHVDPETLRIVEIGEPLADEIDRRTVKGPPGTVAVFPVNPDGLELIWGLTPQSLRRLVDGGYVRVTPGDEHQRFVIAYLSTENVRRVESGEMRVAGVRPDGSKVVVMPGGKPERPITVWRETRHDAGAYGTSLVAQLLPGRSFPFPKSLYGVEDVLRLVVGGKPEATVLDFFAGSGTTAHAVLRLNRQDGGRRRSISVTNNEVSEAEAKRLAGKGLRPGDADWEAFGIFEHVTRPRVEGAVTGRTPEGQAVVGEYKFVDEGPLADGFEASVESFELEYLDASAVELDLAFDGVAPLLWLKAGGVGPILRRARNASGDDEPYVASARYGVLFRPDRWRAFVDRLPASATHAFVVTDSAVEFASIAAELPDRVETVRLYENYLLTFAINMDTSAS